MIGADRPRLGRQVGTDNHRNQTGADMFVNGLMHMGQVALEVMDCRTHKAGSTVLLCFDNECVANISMAKTDSCINSVVGPES